MQLEIQSYFSPLVNTDDDDARYISSALAALGYYKPDPKIGIVAFDPGYKFFDAIKKFQNDYGLFPDGVLRPGGKTQRAINQALEDLQESSAQYIWRTAGDNKVRDGHAARNGKIFRWNENLPGGHPGEDYNCRCWAEPLNISYAPLVPKKKPAVTQQQSTDENPYPDAINPVYPIETVIATLAPALKGVKLTSAAKKIIQQIEAKRFEALERLNTPKEPRWEINPPREKLQQKFEHAEAFGVKGNPNNKTLEEFKKALQRHINDPDTKILKGTYHKKEVTHYYNPNTKLNIMRDKAGEFISGWKLKEKQIWHILKDGKRGGGK